MKLELKHLACYLPYNVIMYYDLDGKPFRGTKKKEVLTIENIELLMFSYHRKPILRPLSDLTKEIEIDNKFIDVAKELFPSDFGYGQFVGALSFLDYAKIFIKDENRLKNCFPLMFWESLFKYHFDVFGLIEKGLAIDKNNLK